MQLWFLTKLALTWRSAGGRRIEACRREQGGEGEGGLNRGEAELLLNSAKVSADLTNTATCPQLDKRAGSSPLLSQPLIGSGLPLRRPCDLGLGSSPQAGQFLE